MAGAKSKPDPDERIRRDALARLARRPLSRSRLADALLKRWKDADAVARTIGALAGAGLIDDRAFADEAVRQIRARGPLAPRALVLRLVKLGVPRALAEERIAAATADDDPADGARALAEQRLSRMPETLPTETKRRRIAGLLARRGYDAEAIAGALERLGRDDD